MPFTTSIEKARDRIGPIVLPVTSASFLYFLSVNTTFISTFLDSMNSSTTLTSARVRPGGSVNHFGSLESVAKGKIDTTHPFIAQHERHIATISRYFFVRRQSVDLSSLRIIGSPCLLLQGPIMGRRRTGVGGDCDTFASVTTKSGGLPRPDHPRMIECSGAGGARSEAVHPPTRNRPPLCVPELFTLDSGNSFLALGGILVTTSA